MMGPSLGLRLVGWIVKTAHAIASGLLLAGVILNFANVLCRYFLSSPISWAEEILVFMMIGGVFLGIVAVSWDDAHIRMKVFSDLFPKRLRSALDSITLVVLIGTSILLVVAASRVLWTLWRFDQRSVAVELPMTIPHAALPIGFALVALVAICRRFSLNRIGNAARAQGTGDAESQWP